MPLDTQSLSPIGQILLKAADLLRLRGHNRENLMVDTDGSLCIRASIQMALGHTTPSNSRERHEEELPYIHALGFQTNCDAALWSIANDAATVIARLEECALAPRVVQV